MFLIDLKASEFGYLIGFVVGDIAIINLSDSGIFMVYFLDWQWRLWFVL